MATQDQKELSGKLSSFNLNVYHRFKDEFYVFSEKNYNDTIELYKDSELVASCMRAKDLEPEAFAQITKELLSRFDKNRQLEVPNDFVNKILELQKTISDADSIKANENNKSTRKQVSEEQASEIQSRNRKLNDLLEASGKDRIKDARRPTESETKKWKKGEINQRMNVPYGALVLANFSKDDFTKFVEYIKKEGVTSLASSKSNDYGPKSFKTKLQNFLGKKFSSNTEIISNPLLLTINRALRLASMFGMVNCSISTLAFKPHDYAKFMLNEVKLENFKFFDYEFRRLLLSFEVGSVTVANTARNYGVLPSEYVSLLALKKKNKAKEASKQIVDKENKVYNLPINVKLVRTFGVDELKKLKKSDIIGLNDEVIGLMDNGDEYKTVLANLSD